MVSTPFFLSGGGGGGGGGSPPPPSFFCHHHNAWYRIRQFTKENCQPLPNSFGLALIDILEDHKKIKYSM